MSDTAKGGSSSAAGRPPWATGSPLGSTRTATFNPPSAFTPAATGRFTAPARPSPSEPLQAKGPRPAKVRAQRRPKNRWNLPGKSSTYVSAFLGLLVVLLVAAACMLVWKASVLSGVESIEAPLPAQEFEKPVAAEPVGPTGSDPVTVNNAKGTRTMTAADMGPNTLFIPALGVYMPVEADTTFVASKYEGFDTIKIPKDAWHGVWYAGGAPLSGGQHGVTMIASHVSTSNGWGALRYLYKLSGGEMIYTKDAEGQLQQWQMTTMRVEKHTEFPQEYWSPEGKRRLVVTTCGGTVNSHNYFEQNIFAVAEPVEPKPKPKPATDDAAAPAADA